MLLGRLRGAAPDPDHALQEDLDEYPLPNPTGPRQLTVEGVPVRVRLVVVAPVGRDHYLDDNSVELLLDQVVHGLADVLSYDRPRIRVWPQQLSSQGFALKFNRLTRRPEPDGQPSHWILIAGQTPPRPRPLLVGLAVWANEANYIGRLTLDPLHWGDRLRVVQG